MLINDLGYRAPDRNEVALSLLANARQYFLRSRKSDTPRHLPAAVLCADPLISYSGMVPNGQLGLASLSKSRRKRRAWFLISPTWSIAKESVVDDLRRRAIAHRFRSPEHKLVFVCNTEEEVAMLRHHGEAAFFHNKTSIVPESIFRPIEDSSTKYDAIYNAQLAAWKRHELSLGIEKCCFLFYRGGVGGLTAAEEAALFARHAAEAPGHVFINPIDQKENPVRLSPTEVNRHLNSASVGLCLSEKEGAMFASTEYLLAGLPVVSTPNEGGRDVYYDSDYCIIAAPDPRAVAEAVNALKARRIPRRYIHRRTLERLERDRTRFINLVNSILAEVGSTERFAHPWRQKYPLMEWHSPARAVARFRKAAIDRFCEIGPAEPGAVK